MPFADPVKRREMGRIYKKRHYHRNRERENARSRAWQAANRERVNANSVARRKADMIERVLFRNAQQRARARGIEFSITVADIVVPPNCPIFGTVFMIGDRAAQPFSPSLDRIDPTRGYVPGNVRVISHRANTIKSDATVDELRAVLAYMEANP
jgi:hypothetical protein